MVALYVPVVSDGCLVVPFDKGGIFVISEEVQQKIRDVRFQGLDHQHEKKTLHMIGYLAELAYDLCIAPSDNVSSNPGFETCLGVFGG